MARARSPGYPSCDLGEAIVLVRKIHDVNRTNPIDREAAAKDMGYTGITGRSAKVISDLSHFGLLEKSGKGGVRVSQYAVDILYGATTADKRSALAAAAFSPTLFSELRAHFSDGVPSENALRSYLMRQGFANVAIQPVINSYLETCRLLQQENVFESHGPSDEKVEESKGSETDPAAKRKSESLTHPVASPEGRVKSREVTLMEGERVIFVEESGAGQYLKLIATGHVDDSLLEALEDYTKRQRKRLKGATTSTPASVEAERERQEQEEEDRHQRD